MTRPSLRELSGAVAAAALALLGLRATAAAVEDVPRAAPWRLGGYVGYANNSPGGESWGLISGRDHLFVALRGNATVLRLGPVNLDYAPEVLPVVIVSDNPKYQTVTHLVGGEQFNEEVETGTGPVYGAGLSPMGLELGVRLAQRCALYGTWNLGILWFTRDVPVTDSRARNYTFDFGGGLRWEYHEGRYLQLAYKFHHLSNMGTADENPGLDANLFYVGWQRRVGGK